MWKKKYVYRFIQVYFCTCAYLLFWVHIPVFNLNQNFDTFSFFYFIYKIGNIETLSSIYIYRDWIFHILPVSYPGYKLSSHVQKIAIFFFFFLILVSKKEEKGKKNEKNKKILGNLLSWMRCLWTKFNKSLIVQMCNCLDVFFCVKVNFFFLAYFV